MSIVDRAVRKIALRWLKRKVDGARKEGNPMLKALDGWKSFVVVLGFIASSAYALATGQDVGTLVAAVLSAVGWADADLIARAKVLATVVAPLLFALWAAVSRVRKAVQQFRAGAKPSELLSAAGYVKAAIADDTLEGMLAPSRVPQ